MSTFRRFGMWVARCAAVLGMVALAGVNGAAAQEGPATAVSPSSLPAAFDVDVVGYHALAVEPLAVALFNAPVEHDIANVEARIAAIKERLSMWRQRLNNTRQDVDGWIDRNTAADAIGKEEASLAEAEAKLAELQKERDLLRQCVRIQEKVELWRDIIADLQDGVAMLEGLETFPDYAAEKANQQRLIVESQGYLDSLLFACGKTNDPETITDGVRRAEREIVEIEKIASKGKFEDLPLLRSKMSRVLGVNRQLQLMGDDRATDIAGKTNEVVKAFFEESASTCKAQSFAVREAFGVNRQSDLMGAGVDFSACLYRLYEAGGFAPENGQGEGWRACIIWAPDYAPAGTWSIRRRNFWYNVDGEAVIDISGSGKFSTQGKRSKQDTATGKMSIEGTVRLQAEKIADALVRIESGVPPVLKVRYMFVTKETILSNESRLRDSGRKYVSPDIDGVSWSLPIRVINNNQPCDPERDVWSY